MYLLPLSLATENKYHFLKVPLQHLFIKRPFRYK